MSLKMYTVNELGVQVLDNTEMHFVRIIIIIIIIYLKLLAFAFLFETLEI
jgi:hypothetical protein